MVTPERKKQLQRMLKTGQGQFIGGTGGEGWFLNLESSFFGELVEPKFVCFKSPDAACRAYLKYLTNKGYNIVEDHMWYKVLIGDKEYRISQCGGTSRYAEYDVL